ncbi:hypothetical protein TSA6c_00320 [Azospirillum sp. TSA6c]|uniref:hypothetical protein n=1 Tax=Azospirillum sp. TSA6c TaxID=709813 RepID=UPI000D60F78C|nr:hypothetical protein [Azospirillum sp. TSA6c]PWC54406.1 hypothetical protein TSA6c_00320 [Azospirillum sp. TSA6c]
MNMTEETMDGILFGLRLASDPNVTARREAYNRRIREDRAAVAQFTAPRLADALMEFNPGYLPTLRERPHADLVERVIFSMQGRNRPKMLKALGVNEWRAPE